MKAKLLTIRCVDVGANVGDTIAAFKEPFPSEGVASADAFVAIEPNRRFRKCLTANWGNDESVTILSCICSSEDGDISARISESQGTAHFEFPHADADDHVILFERRTVDSIVSQYNQFGEFNVLKIDTDGHDFEVLNGAKAFIACSMPFLYFEVDVFSNDNFVNDCLSTLEFLRHAGYRRLFIYDNFGSLMGKFETSDVVSLKRLLFYKITKKDYYFDFLLMKDCFVDEFYQSEIKYFADALKDGSLLQTV